MQADLILADVEAIRAKSPLVHNITNYVVMNTTANALLAIGASPVMAHSIEEVEDMVGIAGAIGGALVINIGTLSEKWIAAMDKAMRAANEKNVPIVFDPVGAGATPYRTDTCKQLLGSHRPSIIRGNASEVMALLNSDVTTKGVDSSATTDAALETAKLVAGTYGCVVSVSGETDIITDGEKIIRVAQGHALMTRVTGLGCTASAITGAFAAVNKDTLAAAAHAMAVMGICGEIAAKKSAGPGTLQLHFYDALHNLDLSGVSEHLRA
ncbi:MAG: hydroxyethylthiazole kinase [Kiritimatiellia bacterium]|jgi:hydroxyethylthiazole kinase